MKKFRTFLLIILIVPCMFLFSACSKPAYVVGIEKTAIDGTSSTYTVTYSDGSTSNFSVQNGADGKDGQDASIESIFKECVKRGLYKDESNESFREFLADYLSVEVEQNDEKAAINKAMCSSVAIFSGNWKGSHIYDMCAGSGVIISMDSTSDVAYILTNYHVAYSTNKGKIATYLTCYLYGAPINLQNKGTEYNPYYAPDATAIGCTYIGGSMNYDLAVLKVSTTDLLNANENARPVTFAEKYEVGETAIAIGNPEGEGISVTKGIINVDSENMGIKSINGIGVSYYRVMRIDTAINGGNSGGGLFNQKGELIGIVNAKLEDVSIDNMAYALPLDNITRVARNIIYNYETYHEVRGVEKLILGVSTIGQNSRYIYNPTTSEMYIVEDTVIKDVSANSLAESVHLQAEDILTGIAINSVENKIDLTRSFQLGDILLDVREGDKIWIYYSRQNSKQTYIAQDPIQITVTSSMLQSID